MKLQVLFDGVVHAVESGGKPQPVTTQLGYTKEQIDAIQKLKSASANWDKLGVQPNASKYVFIKTDLNSSALSSLGQLCLDFENY